MTAASRRLALEMSRLGEPSPEQLRCTLSQPLSFATDHGPVEARAHHADLAPAIRVRRHPDGEHLFAILALGWSKPGCPVIALFHSLTVEELERLSEAAFDAAQAVRRHNKAAAVNSSEEG